MKVWLLFDDYGVCDEGPFFRSAHRTEEGARSAAPSRCYAAKNGYEPGGYEWRYDPEHNCADRGVGGCEGVWWFIQEVEVLD